MPDEAMAFQYKARLSGNRVSQYKGKMVVKPSYRYNGNAYIGKTATL